MSKNEGDLKAKWRGLLLDREKDYLYSIFCDEGISPCALETNPASSVKPALQEKPNAMALWNCQKEGRFASHSKEDEDLIHLCHQLLCLSG